VNDAIDHFQKVVDNAASNKLKAWGYAHLGATYCLDPTQYDNAIEAFQQMANLDVTSAWGYAHQGEAYRLRAVQGLVTQVVGSSNPNPQPVEDDFQQAITAFSKVLGPNKLLPIADKRSKTPLDPNDYWAYAHRGVAYFFYSKLTGTTPEERKKRLQAALADLQKSLQLSEDYAWALVYLSECNCQLALIYTQQRRWKEASNCWYQAHGLLGKAVITNPNLFKTTYLDVAKGQRLNATRIASQIDDVDHPLAEYIVTGNNLIQGKNSLSEGGKNQ
jgi:tetratricopeptide (TPR) repeat protein